MKRLIVFAILILALPALADPGERYVDPRSGFSIVPEADWLVAGGGTAALEGAVRLEVAAPYEEHGFRSRLQVQVLPVGDVELDDVKRGLQGVMDAEGRKIEMHVDVELGGFAGGRFLSKLSRGGVPCMAHTTYVLADGEAYVLEAVAPEESFAFYKEIFDGMADSLVLVEKEG